MKRYADIAGDGGSRIVEQVLDQRARLKARLASVRRVVAVFSGKGGVGKSAVTAMIAQALAADGLAVGVVDADLNGASLGKMLGARRQGVTLTPAGAVPPCGPGGIKAMSMDFFLPDDETPVEWDAPTQQDAYVWRGTVEMNTLREFLADTLWGDLDLLLLDLAPGSDRICNVAGLLPDLAGGIVVTLPSEVASLVVTRSVTAARQAGVRLLGFVENMAGYRCSHCHEIGDLFRREEGASPAPIRDLRLLGSIPFDPALARLLDRGGALFGEEGDRLDASLLKNLRRLARTVVDLVEPMPALLHESPGGAP